MTGHQRKVQTHQPHRGPPLSTLRARLWSVVLLATMICVWVSTSPTSARDINLRVYGGQKRGLDPVEATTQDHAHNKRDDGLNLEKRFTSTRNVELGAPSSRDESSAAIAFNGLDKRSSESEKPKPCDPCCKNACAYYNNCNNICLRSPTCKVCQPPPKPPGSKSRRDLPAPPNADESNTGHVYDKRTADGPFDTGIGTPSSLHERDAGGSPPQIQLADSHLVSKRELVDLKPAAAYLTERNNGPCDACCSNTCFVNGTCDKPCYGPSTCSGCPGFKLPPAHAEPALKREEPLLSPREDFEHGDDNHASGHVKRSRADLSHAATVDALERRDLVCSPCCPSVCAAFGLCGTTCLGPCDCGVAKRSAVFAEIAPREHYDGDAVPTQKRDPQAHRGVSRLPRALPETSTALEHGAASRTTKRSVIGGTEARNLQTSTVPAIYSRTERRDMHLQLPTLHKRGCDACCNVPCGCAGVKNADCSTCSDTLSGIAPAPQAGCETNPWIKRSPSTPPSLDRPLSGRELKSLARADVDSSTLSQRRVEEVMVSSYDCPACCASKTCFVCDCSSGALSLAERKAASPLTIDADAATRPQRRSELMEGSPDICPACCTNPGWCNGACGCGGDYRPRSLSLPGARLTASVAESLQDRTTHAARRVSAMDFDSDPPGQLQQRSELVALDTIDCPTCCANPSTCSECECYETPPLDANLAHRELTIASVTHLERRTEFAKDTGILRTRDGTKDCPPCCLSQSCAPGTVCTGCQPPATNGLEAPESLLTGRAERRNVRDTSTLAMRSPQGGTQEASILKVRAPQNEGPCEDCCFDVVIPCGIEHCSGCPGYQARSIASPVEGASVSLTQSLDRRDAKDMLFGHPAQTRSVRDENEGKDMPTLYVRTSHSSQPASTVGCPRCCLAKKPCTVGCPTKCKPPTQLALSHTDEFLDSREAVPTSINSASDIALHSRQKPECPLCCYSGSAPCPGLCPRGCGDGAAALAERSFGGSRDLHSTALTVRDPQAQRLNGRQMKSCSYCCPSECAKYNACGISCNIAVQCNDCGGLSTRGLDSATGITEDRDDPRHVDQQETLTKRTGQNQDKRNKPIGHESLQAADGRLSERSQCPSCCLHNSCSPGYSCSPSCLAASTPLPPCKDCSSGGGKTWPPPLWLRETTDVTLDHVPEHKISTRSTRSELSTQSGVFRRVFNGQPKPEELNCWYCCPSECANYNACVTPCSNQATQCNGCGKLPGPPPFKRSVVEVDRTISTTARKRDVDEGLTQIHVPTLERRLQQILRCDNCCPLKCAATGSCGTPCSNVLVQCNNCPGPIISGLPARRSIQHTESLTEQSTMPLVARSNTNDATRSVSMGTALLKRQQIKYVCFFCCPAVCAQKDKCGQPCNLKTQCTGCPGAAVLTARAGLQDVWEQHTISSGSEKRESAHSFDGHTSNALDNRDASHFAVHSKVALVARTLQADTKRSVPSVSEWETPAGTALEGRSPGLGEKGVHYQCDKCCGIKQNPCGGRGQVPCIPNPFPCNRAKQCTGCGKPPPITGRPPKAKRDSARDLRTLPERRDVPANVSLEKRSNEADHLEKKSGHQSTPDRNPLEWQRRSPANHVGTEVYPCDKCCKPQNPCGGGHALHPCIPVPCNRAKQCTGCGKPPPVIGQPPKAKRDATLDQRAVPQPASRKVSQALDIRKPAPALHTRTTDAVKLVVNQLEMQRRSPAGGPVPVYRCDACCIGTCTGGPGTPDPCPPCNRPVQCPSCGG